MGRVKSDERKEKKREVRVNTAKVKRRRGTRLCWKQGRVKKVIDSGNLRKGGGCGGKKADGCYGIRMRDTGALEGR